MGGPGRPGVLVLLVAQRRAGDAVNVALLAGIVTALSLLALAASGLLVPRHRGDGGVRMRCSDCGEMWTRQRPLYYGRSEHYLCDECGSAEAHVAGVVQWPHREDVDLCHCRDCLWAREGE